MARRPKTRTLAIVGGVLVVLVLAAVGGRAWVLRDTTEPVSVDRVLDRSRDKDGARVYAYATRGFEEATVLGTVRHDYPATTTITVASGGCGVSLLWEALDRRSERWTVCDGAPRELTDVHSFFGRTDERAYACRGTASAFTCRHEETTRTDRARELPDETLRVDGRPVATRHLRYESRMRGATRGTATYDLWLARDGGPPVRVVADVSNETDTPIGTAAKYRERVELRLRSATPLAR